MRSDPSFLLGNPDQIADQFLRFAGRDRAGPGSDLPFQGALQIRVWAGAGTPRVDPGGLAALRRVLENSETGLTAGWKRLLGSTDVIRCAVL